MNNIVQKNIIYNLSVNTDIPHGIGSDVSIKTGQLLYSSVNNNFQRLLDNDLYIEKCLNDKNNSEIGPKPYSQTYIQSSIDGAKMWDGISSSSLSVLHRIDTELSSNISSIAVFTGKNVNFILYASEYIIGTDSGLYRSQDLNTWYTNTGCLASAKCISYYYDDSRQILLIGTDSNIYQLSNDFVLGNVAQDMVFKDKAPGISGSRIQSIYLNDSKNKIYIGTSNGFYITGFKISVDIALDPKEDDYQLKSKSVYGVLPVGSDNYIAGTSYTTDNDGGLYTKDVKYGFQHLEEDFYAGNVNVIENGWVGTDNGLYKAGEFSRELTGHTINDIFTEDGKVFAGCKDGIYDINGNRYGDVSESVSRLVMLGDIPVYINSDGIAKVSYNGTTNIFGDFTKDEPAYDLYTMNNGVYIGGSRGFFAYFIDEYLKDTLQNATTSLQNVPVYGIQNLDDEYIIDTDNGPYRYSANAEPESIYGSSVHKSTKTIKYGQYYVSVSNDKITFYNSDDETIAQKGSSYFSDVNDIVIYNSQLIIASNSGLHYVNLINQSLTSDDDFTDVEKINLNGSFAIKGISILNDDIYAISENGLYKLGNVSKCTLTNATISYRPVDEFKSYANYSPGLSSYMMYSGSDGYIYCLSNSEPYVKRISDSYVYGVDQMVVMNRVDKSKLYATYNGGVAVYQFGELNDGSLTSLNTPEKTDLEVTPVTICGYKDPAKQATYLSNETYMLVGTASGMFYNSTVDTYVAHLEYPSTDKHILIRPSKLLTQEETGLSIPEGYSPMWSILVNGNMISSISYATIDNQYIAGTFAFDQTINRIYRAPVNVVEKIPAGTEGYPTGGYDNVQYENMIMLTYNKLYGCVITYNKDIQIAENVLSHSINVNEFDLTGVSRFYGFSHRMRDYSSDYTNRYMDRVAIGHKTSDSTYNYTIWLQNNISCNSLDDDFDTFNVNLSDYGTPQDIFIDQNKSNWRYFICDGNSYIIDMWCNSSTPESSGISLKKVSSGVQLAKIGRFFKLTDSAFLAVDETSYNTYTKIQVFKYSGTTSSNRQLTAGDVYDFDRKVAITNIVYNDGVIQFFQNAGTQTYIYEFKWDDDDNYTFDNSFNGSDDGRIIKTMNVIGFISEDQNENNLFNNICLTNTHVYVHSLTENTSYNLMNPTTDSGGSIGSNIKDIKCTSDYSVLYILTDNGIFYTTSNIMQTGNYHILTTTISQDDYDIVSMFTYSTNILFVMTKDKNTNSTTIFRLNVDLTTRTATTVTKIYIAADSSRQINDFLFNNGSFTFMVKTTLTQDYPLMVAVNKNYLDDLDIGYNQNLEGINDIIVYDNTVIIGGDYGLSSVIDSVIYNYTATTGSEYQINMIKRMYVVDDSLLLAGDTGLSVIQSTSTNINSYNYLTGTAVYGMINENCIGTPTGIQRHITLIQKGITKNAEFTTAEYRGLRNFTKIGNTIFFTKDGKQYYFSGLIPIKYTRTIAGEKRDMNRYFTSGSTQVFSIGEDIWTVDDKIYNLKSGNLLGIVQCDDYLYIGIKDNELLRSTGIGNIISTIQLPNSINGVKKMLIHDDESMMIIDSDGELVRYHVNDNTVEYILPSEFNEIGCVRTDSTDVDEYTGNPIDKYVFGNGNTIYKMTADLEQDAYYCLYVKDIPGTINDVMVLNKYTYLIAYDGGLYTSYRGYRIDNDYPAADTTAEIIDSAKINIYEQTLSYHNRIYHNAKSFITKLNSEKMPVDMSELSYIGFENVIDKIEFNDNNNYITARCLHKANLSGAYDISDIDGLTYSCKRYLKNNLKEIIINIPTTNTYYRPHNIQCTKCMHYSETLHNENTDTDQLSGINNNSTVFSIYLDCDHFNINKIMHVIACGSSLPLKMYRDNDHICGGAEKLFHSIVKPTMIMNTEFYKQNGKIRIDFMCFGTDEQSIRLLTI